jgi:hypothetical protein
MFGSMRPPDLLIAGALIAPPGDYHQMRYHSRIIWAGVCFDVSLLAREFFAIVLALIPGCRQGACARVSERCALLAAPCMSFLAGRSRFRSDILFDQGEKASIKIRFLNRLPSHDTRDFGGSGWHRYGGRTDSCARSPFHFLQLAILPAGSDEYDARAVAIVRTRGLQS